VGLEEIVQCWGVGGFDGVAEVGGVGADAVHYYHADGFHLGGLPKVGRFIVKVYVGIVKGDVVWYNQSGDGTMDERSFLPVKSDVVFRLFYADERNEAYLVGFLKSMLDLPDEDYKKLEVADPHLLGEYNGDKLSIIDVKLYTGTGKVVHIEIQLKVTAEFVKRVVYYGAKLVTEQVGKGDEYNKLGKVISIIITEDELVGGSAAYHHRFVFYDGKAGVALTDMMEIHTLELGKLPMVSDGTELYDWAKFINAETEEELKMVAERNRTIEEAVDLLRELSADKEAQSLYFRRELARMDHAVSMRWATEQGVKQGLNGVVLRMVEMGKSAEEIMAVTGLAYDEVMDLKNRE
jgi:predicted transposase/invertase (TIGR01784 family)